MENTRPKNRQWSPKEIDRIDSNKNTPDLRTLVTTHQSERKEQPSPRRRKNLTHSSDRRGLQTVKEDRMNVAAKTQQQIDRNNGRRWDWETALRLLNAQTHYPPVGVSCSANTTASWLGTPSKTSYFLFCCSSEEQTLRYQLKGSTSPRIVTSKQHI